MKSWKPLVVVVSLLLLAACASTGERYLEVRPVPMSVQMVPLEISATLRDLGYDRVDQKDTVVDWSPASASHLETKRGSIIVTTDEYRMLFRSQDDPASFVRVRIKRGSGFTTLTFFEEGRDGLSEAGERRLRAIKETLALHYGEDRVRAK